MGEHTAFYDFLKAVGPFLVVLGGFILSVLIVTKYKVPRLELDLNEMKGIVDGLRKEHGSMASRDELLKSFLDPSGNPRFQSITNCVEVRGFCGRQNAILIQHLGDKMDDVGDRMVDALNEIDRKRSEQQQENGAKFDTLADAVKETNENLNRTNEKLNGVAQRVEVISSNGGINRDNIEFLARTLAEKLKS
jgi:hypothetical protein